MKKIYILVLLCLGLCGCAFAPLTWNLPAYSKIKIGMPKNEFLILYREKAVEYPDSWSKKVINGNTYETFYYQQNASTFDFVNNVLVGYCIQRRYYSKDGVEDLRNNKYLGVKGIENK